jgi:uncharacterized membrane protein
MAEKIGVLVEHASRHKTTVFQTFTSIGLHFLVAFGVMLALTGQAVVSGVVAIVEPVVCHFAHVVHDRVWAFFERGSFEGEPAYATVATDSTFAAT